MPDMAVQYVVKKSEVHRAAVTLASAFHQRKPWNQFFRDGCTLDQKAAFYEIPVRLCMQYGSAYATSAGFEGVAIWLPGEYTNVTLWRALRCGVLPAALRVLRCGTPAAMKQARLFAPLDRMREEHLAGTAHFHLMFVGVDPAYQGHGYGTALVRKVIDHGNAMGMPIYLETQSPRTVAWYEHFGFRVVDRITLDELDLSYAGMVKDPATPGVL